MNTTNPYFNCDKLDSLIWKWKQEHNGKVPNKIRLPYNVYQQLIVSDEGNKIYINTQNYHRTYNGIELEITEPNKNLEIK